MIPKSLKTFVPKPLIDKYHRWSIYREYQGYRKTPGHTYNRFDATKSIFIHIPKAGGISVIKSLYGNKAGGIGHRTYKHFQWIYGERAFNEYYKFTFVRNPYDRLLSAYSFLKKGGMNHIDRRFNEEILSQYKTFEEFVMKGLTEKHVSDLEVWTHFYPQTRFIYDENDNLAVDFVGRFESFNEDYEKIRQKIGSGEKLKHLNKTKDKKAKDYKEAYTAEMREKTAEIYRKDLELLGYDF